jgi:methylglutaconyl-CoA hydratase
VVLAGNGPAFCAGADLNWMKRMAGYTREQNLEDAGGLARMLEVIWRCPKPTIARVQGDTYAGGTGLVAACDIAVAVDTAHFCLSETRLGLIPATISPYVIRAMGARHAHRWFLTAERFTRCRGAPHRPRARGGGRRAARCQGARDRRRAGHRGPEAVKATKQLVQDVAGHEITHGLIRRTAEAIADVRVSDEGREGIRSFLEKRKPDWLLPKG